MAYTVAVSFDQFFDKINLSGDHRATATARKDALIVLLKKHFTVLEGFATGSIPRFTAVTEHADLDVMVALHYGNHIEGKTPAQVLQKVRDALSDYRTNVRKNGQAVTLYYDSWPNVDVVPVSRTTGNNGAVLHYNVPDMNNGVWLQSMPHAHGDVLAERNNNCGANFKKIIKMIKWWNHQHSSLMQSYHIEVLALNAFGSTLADFSWDVFQYFDKAHAATGSPLFYNGELVDGYLNGANRLEVQKRLATARDRARDAWHATYGTNNSHDKAIGIWRQIFGDKFPSYG